MVNAAKKGTRNERKARELYERAGFWVYSPQNPKFGDNDLWNLFDLACFRVTDQQLRFVQVKSNVARGIQKWQTLAIHFQGVGNVAADMLVCHDGDGWRMVNPVPVPGGTSHQTAVDERETDGNMGDDVVEWLRGETA